MDKRIKFHSQNTNLLPPEPKSSFRHLKQGIQEFHRKYVLVPADKAANNVGPDLKLFILVGWGRSFLSVAWPTGVQLMFFFCSGVSKLFGAQGSPSSGSLLNL